MAEDKTKSKVQHEASDFVKDEYLIEHYEYQTETSCSEKVKGRLRSHVQFWEEIGAYSNILDIIKNGYKIPFYSLPSTCFQKNNKSALQHGDFVGKAIAELLDDCLIEECSEVPYIVNPLTVSVQSNGKKRLILDLRCVNLHVLKQRVKYEDMRTALMYLKENSFMFSFDLHAAYHHIEMFYPHTEFWGFSWIVGGEQKIFMFLVLPFGLKSAPYIFTKITRPLIKRWRGDGKRVVMYLDDGIGFDQTFESAVAISKSVHSDLRSSGFVINERKSMWNPIQCLDWLGYSIDTV